MRPARWFEPTDEGWRLYVQDHADRVGPLQEDAFRQYDWDRWRRRFGPLRRPLVAADFTPEGKVRILRARGWTDEEIRDSFADLASVVSPAVE